MTATAEVKPAKKEAVVETVKMADGTLLDFTGKKKVQKDSFVDDGGNIMVRLAFRNGKQLQCTLPASLVQKSAAHGLEQKLGDATAGEEDLEDAVLAVEALIKRVEAGEWTKERDANSMSGTSVLLQAMVEVTGKAVEGLKAWLATKTQAQKIALRDSEKFAKVVTRIEAERKAKQKPKEKVDTSVLDAEIDAIGE